MTRVLGLLLLLRLLGCSEDNPASEAPRRYRETASEPQAAHGTPRERDCADVKKRLEPLLFDLVPNRTTGTGIRDEGGLQELARHTYGDAAVKAAVTDLVRDSGAAFYTPNDSADAAAADTRAVAAYDRLAALCNLSRR